MHIYSFVTVVADACKEALGNIVYCIFNIM